MNDDLNLDRIDQEIRIIELREAAKEAAGGDMISWEDPNAPPEITEQFWANVLEHDQAEETSHFLLLERAGVELPSPQELDDERIRAKLWEIIHALAGMNCFLSQTDHWSDRELYEHLWSETLRELTPDFPPNSGWTHHIDFLSTGSEEDNLLYLKYYADDEYRDRWHEDWPDDLIPPH